MKEKAHRIPRETRLLSESRLTVRGRPPLSTATTVETSASLNSRRTQRLGTHAGKRGGGTNGAGHARTAGISGLGHSSVQESWTGGRHSMDGGGVIILWTLTDMSTLHRRSSIGTGSWRSTLWERRIRLHSRRHWPAKKATGGARLPKKSTTALLSKNMCFTLEERPKDCKVVESKYSRSSTPRQTRKVSSSGTRLASCESWGSSMLT